VPAGRTLTRRYALVLPLKGRDGAAVTASAVPPLSGGPRDHGSEATHTATLATEDRVDSMPAKESVVTAYERLELTLCQPQYP
jgi:hypothetical protein